METTINELESTKAKLAEELARAERKLEEARWEEERKAIEERENAKRIEIRNKNAVYADALVAALVAAGFENAAWDYYNENATVPSVSLNLDTEWSYPYVAVRFVTVYSSNGLAIEVSATKRNDRRFPMRKDCTFSYEKIAAVAAETWAEVKEEREAELKEEANLRASRLAHARICEKYGLTRYTSVVTASRYDAEKLYVNLNLNCTEAEADAVLSALQALGIKF